MEVRGFFFFFSPYKMCLGEPQSTTDKY